MAALRTLNAALLEGIAPGTWVAISEGQDRVVSTGETIDEALQNASQNGEPHPFVIRIPEENSAMIL
jgi:hypothetical protein